MSTIQVWSRLINDNPPPSCDNLKPEEILDRNVKSSRPKVFIIRGLNQTEMGSFLAASRKTIIDCPIDKRPGVYARTTSFIFLETDHDATDLIFKDEMIRKHRYAAALNSSQNKTIVNRFNIYQNEVDTKIWSDAGSSTMSQLFPEFSMAGYHFHVAIIPFDAYSDADETKEPIAPTKLFTNYSGFEISMLEAIANKHGFTMDYSNSEDLMWGVADENGTWNGLTRMILDGEADFMISAVGRYIDRHQVFNFVICLLNIFRLKNIVFLRFW